MILQRPNAKRMSCVYLTIAVISVISILYIVQAKSSAISDDVMIQVSHGVGGKELNGDKQTKKKSSKSETATQSIISTNISNEYLTIGTQGNNLLIHLAKGINPSDTLFSISANGGRGNGNLSSFCNSNLCTIPIVIGGKQQLTITSKGKNLYSGWIQSTGSINCPVGERWEYRICHFSDLYFSSGQFKVYVPYQYEIYNPFVNTYCKHPPITPQRERVHVYASTQPRPIGHQEVTTQSYFTMSGWQMHMLWHQIFEFAVPMYETWSRFMGKDPEVQHYVYPLDMRNIKEIIRSFLPKQTIALTAPTHFTNLWIGMVHAQGEGIRNTKEMKNRGEVLDEEFFDFSGFQHMREFSDAVLRFYKVTEPKPTKKLQILILKRRAGRRLINAAEFITAIKKKYKQADVKHLDLSEYSFTEQIRLVREADILIGAHGSGPSHLVWLKKGKAFIEVFQYRFECRDWYKTIAEAVGVNRFIYTYPKDHKLKYSSTSEKNCYNNNPCYIPCHAHTMNKDIVVEIPRFMQVFENAYKSLT